MKTKAQIIETIGSITKLEKVTDIEHNILPNTLVLQNTDPFPGYTGSAKIASPGLKPMSIFIITQYRYAPEKIARISNQLMLETKITCRASFGEIRIHNDIYPCIRIKGLNCVSQIQGVQESFKMNDVKLKSYKRINAVGKIKVFKQFKIIEISDGLYRDYYENEKFYVRMSRPITWEMLGNMVKSVKNKLNNPQFDTALGVIFRFEGPEDIIRFYDKNRSFERALQLQKMFLEEIERYPIETEQFDSTLKSNEVFRY